MKPKQVVKRGTQKSYMLIKHNNEIIKVNTRKLCEVAGVDGIIRLTAEEFKHYSLLLPAQSRAKSNNKINHFNLQYSGHRAGKKYLLPKIVKHGYFIDDEHEQLPVLSLKNAIICEVVDVKENVNYEILTNNDIKYSAYKNVDEVKKAIIKKYSKSMPKLIKNEILKLGVSVTKLKLIERFDYKVFVDNLTLIKEYELDGTRNGYGKGLVALGKKNKNVVVLCADLADSTKASMFKARYADRFIECGISEQNMMGVAAGLAKEGKIPFVSSYAVFNPGRNWDQLRVSVCYNNLNVNVQGGHAGITVGADGATHQALEDIAITRVLPNLTVIVPCDAVEAEKATIAATNIKGPCYIRTGRIKVPTITSYKTPFKIGKINVVVEGNDASIIACGIMVYEAVKAAYELKKHGINVAVINCHTIKPIDKQGIIKYAKKTRAIVTAEEHQIMGGLGSAVSEIVSEYYSVPVVKVGIKDKFGESGKPEELMKKYGLTANDIINAVKKVIRMKQ